MRWLVFTFYITVCNLLLESTTIHKPVRITHSLLTRVKSTIRSFSAVSFSYFFFLLVIKSYACLQAFKCYYHAIKCILINEKKCCVNIRRGKRSKYFLWGYLASVRKSYWKYVRMRTDYIIVNCVWHVSSPVVLMVHHIFSRPYYIFMSV